MARVQAMTMSDSGEPDTLALPVPDEICQPAAMWRLDGRIAVVTGAGQGNGRAIALGLAAAGAAVAVSDIDPDTAGRTAGEIEVAGGRAFASRVDVADRDACGRFAEETRELLGDAAILINNAGINCRKPIGEPDFEDAWDEVFRINVDGTRNMVRAFLSQLRATRGSIVNLGSIMSFTAGPGASAYAATKGAIAQFTKGLAPTRTGWNERSLTSTPMLAWATIRNSPRAARPTTAPSAIPPTSRTPASRRSRPRRSTRSSW